MKQDSDFLIADLSPFLDFAKHDQSGSQCVPTEPAHSNLRFVKIPPKRESSTLGDTITCELTEKGAHRGELRYVAGSYCWESSKAKTSTNNPASSLVPSVKIREGTKVRGCRAPITVLLRAIKFAWSKDVSLIWIGQECVNQKDAGDVQSHLYSNHVIFSQAKFKIGLLNYEITNERELGTLESSKMIGLLTPDILCAWGIQNALSEILYLTRLLRAISKDRWLTRAWVFQERYSANITMTLLLPVTFAPSSQPNLLGNDFALDVSDIVAMGLSWLRLFDAPQLEQLHQTSSIPKQSVHDTLSRLHEIGQILGGPVFSGASLDTVWGSVGMTGGELDRLRKFRVNEAFVALQRCDCTVFSDRLAILSNIMGFTPTTKMTSYSLSLLFLLLANRHFPTVLVETDRIESDSILCSSVTAMDLVVWANNLEILIESLHACQQELDDVLLVLGRLFGKDVRQPATMKKRTTDLMNYLRLNGHEDPPAYLTSLKISGFKIVPIIPLNSTIYEILGGIVTFNHVDSGRLTPADGHMSVKYGVRTNQLKSGARFVSFAYSYRWNVEFFKERFGKETA